MRVLFDGYWWQTGPLANRSVQRELVYAWTREFPDDQLFLALRRGVSDADVPPQVKTCLTALWPHAVSNRTELAALARRVKADVTVAHNYAPLGCSSAVFIHDAMFVDHPEWFSRAERLYFSPMLRWSGSANIVATSSVTEACRIRRLLRSANPVLATGLGVPSTLTEATQRRPSALANVDSFALTVGRLNIRKNLHGVLEAAARARCITHATPLVVVGDTAHSGVSVQIPARVADAVSDGRIRLLGGVVDDQLAWLYAHSAVTITLSRDEGFGMPAVEAAWFGSPLVASDIPVFRETVGNYATFAEVDEPIETTAARVEAAWGAAPTVDTRRTVTSHYTWERAVHALRAALTG